MPTSHSGSIVPWRELEKKSPEKQKKFLDEWKDSFKRESVSSDLQNIKKGDHLVCKGSTNFLVGYEHHFLCSEVKYSDEKRCKVVEVVEYTTDPWPSANPTGYLRASGSADLTGLGKIKYNTFTYEELKKNGAKKEVWPEKLERFDAMEVVKRAKKRVGESYYDIFKNNCEHFVRWCKCGLRVSLQVKSWYTWARECLYSLVAGGKELISQKFGKQLIYLIANVSDELVVSAGAGFVIGFALEAGLSYYEIGKARDQRKKDLIENDELLRAKIREIKSKAVYRLGLGTIGSVFGLVGGPTGSLIGGIIGGAAGHFLGSSIA